MATKPKFRAVLGVLWVMVLGDQHQIIFNKPHVKGSGCRLTNIHSRQINGICHCMGFRYWLSGQSSLPLTVPGSMLENIFS